MSLPAHFFIFYTIGAGVVGMRKNIKFHIKEDDYFASLATVLDLLRQSADTMGYKQRDSETLEKVRDDLIYLQRYYKIVGKNKAL